PPVAVAVLVVAGDLLEVQDARLQAAAASRVAALHIHCERFDQHRSIRETPSRRLSRGRLWIGNDVKADLALARQSQEAFLHSMVRPQRSVDAVRNQPGLGFVSLVEAKSPVSLSFFGKSALTGIGGAGARRCTWPPTKSRKYSSPASSSPKLTTRRRVL